jgi:hypothetical protein
MEKIKNLNFVLVVGIVLAFAMYINYVNVIPIEPIVNQTINQTNCEWGGNCIDFWTKNCVIDMYNNEGVAITRMVVSNSYACVDNICVCKNVTVGPTGHVC